MTSLMVQWPDAMAFDAFSLLPAANRLQRCFQREVGGDAVDPAEGQRIEQELEREMAMAALVMTRPKADKAKGRGRVMSLRPRRRRRPQDDKATTKNVKVKATPKRPASLKPAHPTQPPKIKKRGSVAIAANKE